MGGCFSHQSQAPRKEIERVEDFYSCSERSPLDNIWRKEMVDKKNGTYKPAIPLTHIICGQIKQGKASGFHFRPGGRDPPCARASEKLQKCCDWIECFKQVEIYDYRKNEWILKQSEHNSFFPEDWSLDRIIDTIDDDIFGKVNMKEEEGSYCPTSL